MATLIAAVALGSASCAAGGGGGRDGGNRICDPGTGADVGRCDNVTNRCAPGYDGYCE